MWLMLQKKKPEDYVIATGNQTTVKNFINIVSKKLNLKIFWRGKGINEKAYDINKNVIVACNKAYYRPLEVNNLLGDARKARRKLNWKPKSNLQNLVSDMILSEMQKY